MIKFKSQATGDLVMVQVHARKLLHALGKSPDEPGIIEPQHMAAALATLKNLPDDPPPTPPADDAASQDDEQGMPELAFSDEPVSLRKRAWPLIQMIERAQAADKPIVWGV